MFRAVLMRNSTQPAVAGLPHRAIRVRCRRAGTFRKTVHPGLVLPLPCWTDLSPQAPLFLEKIDSSHNRYKT